MNKKEFIKKLVNQSYSTIDADFNQTRRKHPWPDLLDLASQVETGDNILDLGCGNGRLLKALPKVNFDYLGIDANAYLLQQARQDFPEREFKQAVLPEINLGDNMFDKVFMIATFHHLIDRQDRLRLLQTIHKSLKPGGQLLMTNWRLWQKKYLKYLFKWPVKKVAWNDFFIPWGKLAWRYYHGFTKMELEGLLSEAGFESKHFLSPHNYITIAKKH